MLVNVVETFPLGYKHSSAHLKNEMYKVLSFTGDKNQKAACR